MLIILVVVASLDTANAFLRPHFRLAAPRKKALLFSRLFMGPRYGPNEDLVSQSSKDDSDTVDLEQQEWERAEAARVSRQKMEFESLIQTVLSTPNPQHVPSIMTKHMELLLNIRGYEGSKLIESILQDAELTGTRIRQSSHGRY